jgi:DNA-binding transcriptional LysR family regulator
MRLEALAADLEHIGDALGTGALDLAVGFLPALGPPIARHALFRDPYVCLMRADHPAIDARLTRKKFVEASHVLVTYRGGGHRVIEEALERAGVARRIALRVPHFTVVPMVLERTDLILTLPARVARVYERQGKFKSLPPPVPMPPAEVAVHWPERFEADPGNRWLREQVVELFAG